MPAERREAAAVRSAEGRRMPPEPPGHPTHEASTFLVTLTYLAILAMTALGVALFYLLL